jgi:hypothetical protein
VQVRGTDLAALLAPAYDRLAAADTADAASAADQPADG